MNLGKGNLSRSVSLADLSHAWPSWNHRWRKRHLAVKKAWTAPTLHQSVWEHAGHSTLSASVSWKVAGFRPENTWSSDCPWFTSTVVLDILLATSRPHHSHSSYLCGILCCLRYARVSSLCLRCHVRPWCSPFMKFLFSNNKYTR